MASNWPPGFEIFWVHICSCTSSFQCMIMEHPVGGGHGNLFSGSVKSEPFSEQGSLNQSPMNVWGLFQILHNMWWKGTGCRTRPENPAVFYDAKYHKGLQTQRTMLFSLIFVWFWALWEFSIISKRKKKPQTPKQNNKTTAKDTTGSNPGKPLLIAQLAALLAILIWVCVLNIFSQRWLVCWLDLCHLDTD